MITQIDYDPSKRYYSQVAEKIGHLIRKDLILRQKSHKNQQFNASRFAQSLHSLQASKVTKKHRGPKLQLFLQCNINVEKRETVHEFKERLKHNINESRIKKELRMQELANKVRWRKNHLAMQKQAKLEEQEKRKRSDIRALKSIMEKSKQHLRITKRQTELEHTFMCFERRLKTQKRDISSSN